MNRNVFKAVLVVPVAIAAVVIGSGEPAVAEPLSSQSRQELQRVFGAGRASRDVLSAGEIQSLSAQSRKELQRTFGQTLQMSQDIRMAATPATTNRLQQLALLTGNDPKSYLTGWHNVALDVTALDHAPTLRASPATFHAQFGPGRAARALAMVHLAMFEAANRLSAAPYHSLIYGIAEPVPAADSTAVGAAITEAAFQVLEWLYPGLTDTPINPAQTADACSAQSNFSLREYNHCSLEELTKAFGEASTQKGVLVGREIAARIIKKYQGDGSGRAEPSWLVDFAPRTPPSGGEDYPITQWQVDPVSQLEIALGGFWGDVTPIAPSSAFKHRVPESKSPVRMYAGKSVDTWDSYPALVEWAGEYRLNSTGLSNPASTAPRDGFFVAQFWAYDATAGLCAPARLYNQIAERVLAKLTSEPASVRSGSIDVSKVEDVARLFAVVNIAMSDAAIAAWDSKYYFQFPRPVTAIRAHQKDENKLWYPLGAQVSNSENGKNITPPFPAYPSGHATFGGALFGVLRQYVSDPNAFTFSFQSDEFNGKNRDVYNYVRCADPSQNPDGSQGQAYKKFCEAREFTFDCAERENADSRIFMGVHWIIDADDGIELGNRVAHDVYKSILNRRAGGSPTTLFSATPGKTRSQLVCPNVAWPTAWEDKFGLKDFRTPDIR